MRKGLIVAAAIAVVFGACAQDEPVVEPPVATEEADATQTPEETGGDAQGSAETNDHGTETFTTESFELELEMDDFYFEPTFIKSPGGATAMIELVNEGEVPHTFTIDDLDVDEEVAPGDRTEVEVDIGTESRYEFYCRFHEAQGMRGAFQPH